MEIRNLENISSEQLTQTVNEAFADYMVPMQLTRQQLERRNIAVAVDPRLSAGVFDGGKLVGVLLHGVGERNGKKALYNAMTGIIPAYRGRRLTSKMYEYLRPAFKEAGAHTVVLEFIVGNDKAFKAYKSAGFEISRDYICMKGEIGPLKQSKDITVKETDDYDWAAFESFWSWQPSWQNHIPAAKNSKADNALLCAYSGGVLAAYAIFTRDTKRVMQFATAKDLRGRGAMSAVFKYLADKYGKEIAVINIDERAKDIPGFLEYAGLKKFVSLKEMQMFL